MPSGLLNDQYVRYYHPVDNLTEYTQDVAWTGTTTDFVPSILTSGIKPNNTTARIDQALGGDYNDIENVSGFTMATWVSGFLSSDGYYRYVYVGFGNGGNTARNTIRIYKDHPTVQIAVEIEGTPAYKDWTPTPPSDDDWHLIVADARYETSGWRHRVSLDGSGWVDLGVDSQTSVPGVDERTHIFLLRENSSASFIVDETVFWGGNDLFTTQELSNLYELYNTYAATMDQYSTTFGTLVSSGMNCFINGSIQTSGDTSLYINGQYGLLYDEFVKYYHPVDDNVEFTKNLAWTPVSTNFVPGLFTSGIRPNNQFAKISLDGYGDLSGASGFTMAVWTSGLLGNDGSGRGAYAGFSDAATNKRNVIRIFKQHPTIRTSVYIEGVQANRDWSPTPSSDDDWHFFVVDARYETSGWRHRVSLDGSDWIDLGVDTQSGIPETDERAYIESFVSVSGVPFVMDEVVLWGSNNLFTYQELSNLHKLGDTYNRTMNQYLSTFFPISGEIDLYTKGNIQSSGNISIYTSGIGGISASADLFLKVATSSSGSADLYLRGKALLSDNIDQYINGHQIASGSADLYLLSTPQILSSGNLYISGPILVNDNFDASITGHLPVSGDSSLFIQGRLQDINAYVAVADNNPSDSFTLFAHGVPSGDSTTFYTNDSATLFINDSGDITDVSSSWSAFTKVADAISASGSGTWSSFVRVGNVANDDVYLYINGHVSGDSPHGPLISNSFDIFINGLATQEGDEGLLSDGYSVANSEISSFVRIYDGLNDAANLYISGEVPIIPPSATMNLFTFGISGIESGSSTLYIPSDIPTSGTFDLFVFGIQGIGSGSATLYLGVTNIGLFNQEVDLYTHGY